MQVAEPSWQPAAILARGVGWGCVGGAVGGVLVIAVPATVTGQFVSLILCIFAAPVGGIVGTVLGLACAAVLLISGRRWPREHPDLVRLLAGGSAAVPSILVLACYLPVGWGTLWLALTLSALFFVTGALLAHRVLWGVWVLPYREPVPKVVGNTLTA
jgi:hypothetical protein